MSARIGIDIGGTFTDLVLRHGDEIHNLKVPSTRPNPADAVRNGLPQLFSRGGITGADVTYLAHGTTVALNAMLEGAHARIGLITTRGFRDVLEIARQRRPSLYNLFFTQPEPLVPRDRRLEVSERITAAGEILVPLRTDEVLAAAEKLVASGVEALVIGFLHSYVNPVHEDAAAAAIAGAFPDLPVWTSSQTISEYREYERLSTATVDAALGPTMVTYLDDFVVASRGEGVVPTPYLMQSNGGVTTVSEAARRPSRTLLSGPAAGVLGAIHVAQAVGEQNLITFDIGGTSTDISLVRQRSPLFARVRDVAGLPVRGATMDLNTIGAGGGSIAWVDAGGRLRVGPQSAGARPGPAAYGFGATEPTVTDANVVAGLLPPGGSLGGEVTLDASAALEVVSRKVAEPLDLEPLDAVRAILRVVNTNMSLAARVVSVARGYDPREYTLVAYGGAGPLHAVAVARELGIPRVFVPPTPGTLSALGLLVSDRRTEFTQTRVLAATPESLPSLAETWDDLADRAEAWVGEHGGGDDVVFAYEADVRYAGQHHELSISVPPPSWNPDLLNLVVERFCAAHELRNGYAAADEPTEIVTLRVIATVPRPSESGVLQEPSDQTEVDGNPRSERLALWGDSGPAEPTPIYWRDDLGAGTVIAGPAVIEQSDTTTAIPPGAVARSHGAGGLTIDCGDTELPTPEAMRTGRGADA